MMYLLVFAQTLNQTIDGLYGGDTLVGLIKSWAGNPGETRSYFNQPHGIFDTEEKAMKAAEAWFGRPVFYAEDYNIKSIPLNQDDKRSLY